MGPFDVQFILSFEQGWDPGNGNDRYRRGFRNVPNEEKVVNYDGKVYFPEIVGVVLGDKIIGQNKRSVVNSDLP